jgi:Gcd10p family protein
MRIDTLSQMMNLGNARPGGRYIAVDDASGMVVSALLERLGGQFPIHAPLTSAPLKLEIQVMGD